MTSLHSSAHDLFLPNPELGDTRNIQSTMERKLASDGTRRTYVRTSGDQLLSYTFQLTVMKAEELKVFVDNNIGAFFRLHNHNDEDWWVRFISNPIDYVQTAPDIVTVNLQFQGTRL